jgi:TldD protein
VVKLSADSDPPFFLKTQIESKKTDFYDVRAQTVSSTIIQLLDGQPTQATKYTVSGIGMRVLRNGSWGFASTSELDDDSLKSTCSKAMKLCRIGRKRKLSFPEMKPITGKYIIKPEQDPLEVSIKEKLDRLIGLEKLIKGSDSRVKSTQIRYSDSVEEVSIFNSEGSDVTFSQPRIDISFNVVVNDGVLSQRTRGREAAIGGYEFFDNPILTETAQITVKRACDLLKAKKVPSGKMTTAMDPSVAGLFLHEAFGHSAEADSVMQGRSFLADKIGDTVASDIVTVYSDPTLSGSSGSYPFDSEAAPAVKTRLIENGVFKSYMHSRTTAAAYGVESTSNARAEDYGKPPIVRMNNLYLESGSSSLEEIIRETRRGIYLVAGGGGLEDPEKGRFQFSVQNCYEIKDGELGSPLRGTSISGWTIETMRGIDMLSKNFAMDVGSCGKGEPLMQIVPVGNGGPYMRVNNVMLGG